MRLALFLFAAGLSAQSLPLGGIPVSSASTVATPTDSPGAGTYSSTQSVTLSDATGSSTICYTIDGSTPGASTPGTCNSSPTTTYSTAISVAATTTIKALGTKTAFVNSGVLTSLYTITATRQFSISGGAFVNQTSSTRSYMIAGGVFINER